MTPSRPLTPKQERFLAAYCGHARFNATRAAILAGYSAKSARKIGYQLQKTSSIRARIREVLDAESLTATEILHELSDVAMRGLDEFVQIVARDAKGFPIAARMDASAKMRALDALARAHGLYTERVQHSGALAVDGGITVRIVGVDVDKL